MMPICSLRSLTGLLFLASPVCAAAQAKATAASSTATAPVETALANNNTMAAGTSANGTLRVRLVARRVTWHPEADDGPSLEVEAFGEDGKRPSIPGSLLRGRVGTVHDVSVRNSLPDTLLVFGILGPAAAADTLRIPPGAEVRSRATLTIAGTYAYGGATIVGDSLHLLGTGNQLLGALVVDDVDAQVAWIALAILAPSQLSALQAENAHHPILLPDIPPGASISAIAQDSSLILAWINDSLRVARVDAVGHIRVLMVAQLPRSLPRLRVTQLAIYRDSIHVLLSDRRTRYITGREGGFVVQEDLPLIYPEHLQKTFSAVGIIGAKGQELTILMPLLLPKDSFGREVDAVIVGQNDRWAIIDTIHLGRRIVKIEGMNGPSIIYDSPMRVLHDEGSHVAISNDASTVAVVDFVPSDGRQSSLRARLYQWKGDALHFESTRWTTKVPQVSLKADTWRSATSATALKFRSLFADDETAFQTLGKLAKPGDPLPPIRTIRTETGTIAVELNRVFAEQAGLARIIVMSGEMSCYIDIGETESVVAISQSTVWTLQQRSDHAYVAPYALCNK